MSKKKSLKLAALIVSSEVFISQLIRLSSNLILTRLLSPEMFGVMTVAMIFIVGITMLSDLGIREKYTQSNMSDNQSFINTCWSIQVIRGIFIALIIALIGVSLIILQGSGFIYEDSVYNDDNLPFVVIILSFTAVLQGLKSIREYDLYRKINVYDLAKINLYSQIFGTIAMIISALYFQSLWVLVVAPILSSFLKTVLTYKVGCSSVRHTFEIDKKSLKDIYGFSKWIFIGSLLSYLLMSSDRIILGGLLTPEILGIYSIAFLFSNAANELFTKLISKIVYPKLTETVKEDQNKLFNVMYGYRVKVDFFTYIISGFLFAAGSSIIYLLYDERYHDAGWMFEILSISIIFIGINISHFAIMALGKSYSYAVVNFISVIIVVIGMPLIYKTYGLEATVLFIALRKAITIPVIFYIQNKCGLFSFFKEIMMVPLFILGYYVGIYFNKLIFLYGWVS